MSKFKKKKGGGLPAISTASLPDIVFMLLFFFMVATVLRKNNLLVENRIPPADQIEKLDKTRTVFIYVGKPTSEYVSSRGTEAVVQIGDKFVTLDQVQSEILAEVSALRSELQDFVTVALKVDEDANAGVVNDVKQILRKANLPKIIYITANNSATEG